MEALIDADILRYEIGFAAETGWREVTKTDDPPDWDFVENLLTGRLEMICDETGADSYRLFLTEGETFRFKIAKTKPYKGNRKENKPFHYNNLTVYMKDVLGAEVVKEIEADDMLAIVNLQRENTILCSRDKDLRQVPGRFFSWELGRQPSFGPTTITQEGWLKLSSTGKRKLSGCGLPFFFSQVLTGDPVDNIPGCKGVGPVAAYEMLKDKSPDDMQMAVELAYEEKYGDEWEEMLLEQGRLCWITRRLNADGTPQLWELGLYD